MSIAVYTCHWDTFWDTHKTMARSIRAPKLENRSSRLKLPVAKKPVFVKIDRGIALGYRRNARAGTWVVRVTRDGRDWTAKVGIADDFEEAVAGSTLTYWDAQARARELALGQYERDSTKPLTVAAALDAYDLDLKGRGADPRNADMVRTQLPPSLANKAVALLTARELRHWRDGLLKRGLKPASVKRLGKPFKAALTLAARHDRRITNADAWKYGLGALPDAENSRNVILPEPEVRALIDAAWEFDSELGLFVETAAVTGARPSQLARLNVGDLSGNKSAPVLNMPTSKKGRGQKRVTHYPLPVPSTTAEKLRSNRSVDEPLLLRRGARWRSFVYRLPFRAAVERAGLDPNRVTLYALRHSSIVRQLLSGLALRVVCANHDTSAVMVEKNYSKHIASHSDELTRRALLDPAAAPSGANVVPLRG